MKGESLRSGKNFGKQKILQVLIVFIISQFIYCASAKRYVAYRARDAGDIFNLGIEINTYGLYTTFPGVIGSRASGGKGFGMRHGHFGFYRTGDDENPIRVEKYSKNVYLLESDIIGNEDGVLSFNFGNSWPGWLSYYHEPIGKLHIRNFDKKFKGVIIYNCRRSLLFYYKDSKNVCGYFKPPYNPLSNVELSAGLYFGLRFGINFNELVDFLVGIIGFDLMDDDLLSGTPVYRELPLPIPALKDWESKLDTLDEKMDKKLEKK